jgi:dihydrofolate reductase
MISLITAMDRNRNIGLNGDMPWGKEMKADLRRFKELTNGKPVIMGMKTYNSLPIKPLPNRKNIVLTRDPRVKMWGPYLARSVEEALAAAGTEKEVFIIGGAQIYEQFLPYADKIYVTKVLAHLEGDTKFPAITGAWDIAQGGLFYHPDDKYGSQYITYTRRKSE